MSKKKMLLVSLALIVFILSACSPAASPAPAAPQPAEPAAPAPENPPAAETPEPADSGGEKAVLTFMKWGEGAELDSNRDMIRRFNEENENIEVKAELIQFTDYLTKLNTLISADAVPDVFYINEYLAVDWGQKGVGADLRPMYEKAGIDAEEKYLPAALFQSGDQIWALSSNLATILMYYNKQLFTDAGLPLPSSEAKDALTWDQLVDAAMKITTDKNGKHPGESGFDPKAIMTYGVFAPDFWLYNMPLLYSNHASYAAPDGMSLGLTSPEAVEVMQGISDLMNKHYVAPSIAVSKSLPSQTQMLIDGQLGISFSGLWDEATYVSEGFDVGIAPMPRFQQPTTIAWSACYMVSGKTKYPDEAFKLFLYCTDPDVNPENLKVQLPNTKSFYTESDKYEKWAGMAEHAGDLLATLPSVMETSIAPENVTLKNFSQIVDQTISPAMDKLWLGEISAADLAAELEVSTAGQYQGRWDR